MAEFETELERIIQDVIQQTRMNQLVWTKTHSQNPVTLETKAKIDGKKVTLLLESYWDVPTNAPTYAMNVFFKGTKWSKNYKPLETFGRYMFLDDLK